MIGGDAAAPLFRRHSPKGSSLWKPRGIWRNTMCIDCAAAL
jgi:hypothetical protein